MKKKKLIKTLRDEILDFKDVIYGPMGLKAQLDSLRASQENFASLRAELHRMFFAHEKNEHNMHLTAFLNPRQKKLKKDVNAYLKGRKEIGR